MNDELICAFATAPGTAALAVLRISGQGAAQLADKIFRFGPIGSSNSTRKVVSLNGYQAAYGHVIDPLTQETVDEVVLLRYKEPHSYTGEEMVEISCHGNSVSRTRLLEACQHAGCRLATKGEFSKRAFLNGKFTLTEAEGLADLLQAEEKQAQKLALQQLSGALGRQYSKINSDLLDFEAKCQMAIEFPEYPEYDISSAEYTQRMKELHRQLKALLAGYNQGKIIKEGLKIAILGAPNAGKSSLLNAILDEDKAIVTDIAGTTRDVLEAETSYKGILYQFKDTAGIRNSSDKVEKEGIKRSFKSAFEADVVLWLVGETAATALPADRSSASAPEWETYVQGNLPAPKLLQELQAKGIKLFFVVTKQDLSACKSLFREIKQQYAVNYPVLPCSVYNRTEITQILTSLYDYYLSLGDQSLQQNVKVSSLRQYQGLCEIEAILQKLDETAAASLPPLDILDQMLQACLEKLALITGQKPDEAVIETIFSRFCVGK